MMPARTPMLLFETALNHACDADRPRRQLPLPVPPILKVT